MGRPTGGELLIADHHWTTRLLLLATLVFVGSALLVLVIDFFQHLGKKRPASDIATTIVASYTYSFISWAAWWFGPYSWSAVARLRDVLQLGETKT